MKTDKKEHIQCDLIYIKFWEMETNIYRQKSGSVVAWKWELGEAEGSGERN